MPKNELILHITAHDAATLQHQLAAAVETAEQSAMKGGRHGVLLIQHDYTTYTVSVTNEVPFGTTREQRNTDTAHKSTAIQLVTS